MSNILGNMPPVFGSGYRGVVPAPTAADVSAQNILRADGTWGAGPSGTLPSQTGNAGELLTTDGTNASWASSLNTFQFGDVTLGASGPSVKSTLSARAPRQGLVFDGTQVPIATSISSIGTRDYSWAAYVTNRAIPTAASFVVGVNDSGSDFGGNRSALMTLADGTLQLIVANATTSLGAADTKTNLWVVTRSGTTLTVYKNGVSVTTTTDSQTYGSSYFRMGGYATSNALWQGGVISAIYPYNRALSASEVVALYEAGAPAGADYNNAGQTLPITGYNLSGVTNLGGGVYQFTASGNIFSTTSVVKKGKQYTAVFNVDAISGAVVIIWNGTGFTNTGITTTGLKSFTYTALADSTFGMLASGGTMTISAIAPYGLGLLLAPDAAQAGGGLTWYDTSGNAANITLPASGVSWNVPSSRVLGGNWTNTGNLTLSTSGSSINTGTSNASDSAYISLSGGGAAGNGRGSSVYVTGNEFTTGNAKGSLQLEAGYDATMSNILDGSVLFGTGGTAVVGYFNRLGNLILGPAVADSANGRLQLATHTTSAGGIGFGTDVSLFRRDATALKLNSSFDISNGSTGASIVNALQLNGGGSSGANNNLDAIQWGGGGLAWLRIYGIRDAGGGFGGTQYFQTMNGSGTLTTALTLDSSQLASFAGNVRIGGTDKSLLLNGASTQFSREIDIRIAGDTEGRLLIRGGGSLLWGDGAGTFDSALARTAANMLTVTGSLTIGSVLKLGNAYTAGAPTATGYVTIQDSAGNTYKVLVGT